MSHSNTDFYFNHPQSVGSHVAPAKYRTRMFMDMVLEAEPVGTDPATGEKIYWGEGHEITCAVEGGVTTSRSPLPF